MKKLQMISCIRVLYLFAIGLISVPASTAYGNHSVDSGQALGSSYGSNEANSRKMLEQFWTSAYGAADTAAIRAMKSGT